MYTAIIDYGVGNLFSLAASLDRISEMYIVTSDLGIIRSADRLILPGVGAFKSATDKLKEAGLWDEIIAEAKSGKPLLGICLGMQLLLERSFEYGEHSGLGLIHGSVMPLSRYIDTGLKIPHIGWNAICFKKPDCPIFKYLTPESYVYFVHSYYATDCEDYTAATAEYSKPVTAAVWKENIFGCQFHPEKSGENGLMILKAFCGLERSKPKS